MTALEILKLCLAILLTQMPASGAGDEQQKPITVTAVGDINLGTAYPSEEFLPQEGGAGLLAPVHELLAGDVVFANLEGPLADDGKTDKCSSPRGCFAFRTPTSYVKNLTAAGFNVLSIANNHSMDFGEEGRQKTIETLDAAGIKHSGPPGDIAEIPVRGKSIALVAFTTAEHSHNLLEVDKASQIVEALDKKHDLVIVSFHGGNEGSKALHVHDKMEHLGSEPRGHLIHFAHSVIDAGADLVLGHGPHVLRGMEVYRRRLIVYSLGNFCTYARFNLSGPLGLALVLSVDLSPENGEFLAGRLHSTFQKKPGGAKPDPANHGAKLAIRLSKADFPYSAPLFAEGRRILAPAGDGAGLFTLTKSGERKKLKTLLAELSSAGLAEDKLRMWFGDERARLLPEVMKKFRKPAEKMPYSKYRAIFVKTEVIEAGKEWLEQKAQLLSRIEEKYRVDAKALAGLIATETRFGTHRGKYRTFNALSTVVFRYRRRSSWGQNELRALLEVFAGDPLSVTGSYAGAVGLVQFMPTSIQAYGEDLDGDGHINLDDWEDALASAANYLKKNGWKMGKPIRRGGSNYRALLRYNPAHNYVRVIRELATKFGYRKKQKATKASGERKKGDKKKETGKRPEETKAKKDSSGGAKPVGKK